MKNQSIYPRALCSLGGLCALLSMPLSAGKITFTLADASGKLSVSTPLSTSWPFGNDTANAQSGVTIGGTPGGSFAGGYNPTLPVWSGTLGADGKTITASAKNGAGAPAPTLSFENVYPLGLWNAQKKGGTVAIPTLGYFNITKNNGAGSAGMTNTIGNVAASSSASWTFVPGIINNDWDGTETASVGKVAKNALPLPANTRAAADVSDPFFLYLSADDEPLTFQVAVTNLIMDIAADQPADAYYSWTVKFGSGETAGENVLYSNSGGQDFTAPGTYSLNPGTVVNYSNSSLSAGVYWLTADLNVAAEVATPEPAPIALAGVGLVLIGSLRRRRGR